jgi:enoyl-CoA hydratase/carnithine racemase
LQPSTGTPLLLAGLMTPLLRVKRSWRHTLGCGLALAHDYRVMKDVAGGGKGRAWLCMNEVDFGASLPHGLNSIIKAKMPSPSAYRQTVLTGHRWTAKEALEVGLVDATAATGAEVIQRAIELGAKVAGTSKGGVSHPRLPLHEAVLMCSTQSLGQLKVLLSSC